MSGQGKESSRTDRRPVVVGEVLFDLFPDGARVLGGAPFNVAWHLQAFGLRPLMLSRVGADRLGDEILEAMRGWGMDTAGIQTDPDAPTGRVRVELEDGVPRFEILADQAYDRLDGAEAESVAAELRPDLLYHGTLIARTDQARSVLTSLRDGIGAPAFVDVNLRDPWWRREWVGGLMRGARWVKLNEDELGQLIEDTGGDGTGGAEIAAAELARRFQVEQVVVTCGDRGAFVWVGDRSVAGRPPQDVAVVDTVGAGDAFSAVWIAGLFHGWSAETTLVRALEFAAAVCGIRGATTADREIYHRHLELWEHP